MDTLKLDLIKKLNKVELDLIKKVNKGLLRNLIRSGRTLGVCTYVTYLDIDIV